MSNYKRSVFIIAGFGFAILFIYITTFFGKVADAKIPSDNLGDWIANWIHAYQALLSAIIATVGVLLTIIAMNKNNKELLYVEWRTLIFKAMNFKAHLDTAINYHDVLAYVEINSIKNSEDLSNHCDRVYENLMNMYRVLLLIKSTDLYVYMPSSIDPDIASLEQKINSFLPILWEYKQIKSFDEFSLIKYRSLVVSASDIYAQINARSAVIVEHFIEGSRRFNPMSLHVKGF